MHDRPLKRPAMYNAINSSTANLVGSPHQHGRSNSVSSSISTVKRSASFSSNSASTTVPTHRPSESVNETNRLKKPAALSSRRRSSVAHAATDGISGFNGVGNLNRWSQSTTSSKSSGKEPVRANFSRRLSASNPNFFASNGSAGPKASPPRYPAKSSRSSPPPSPRRRHRPSSPNHSPSQSVTTLPILSAKVYDPKAPISTPSTSDAYTPASQSTGYSDYFSTPTFAPGHDRSNTTPNRPGRTELDRNGLRLPQSAGGPGSTSQHPQRLESRERGGSRDLGHRRAGSSVDSRQHSRDPSDGNRQRGRREKDKKTMLSRALQKANTAVLLDNASNFEGAIEAYSDACSLLQQVMIRSSGEEDRRKLEAIRVTYTNRIEELRQLGAGQETSGKSLPARPMSNESFDIDERSILLDTNDDDDEIAVIQTATMTRILNDPSIENQNDMETSKPKPSMLQQDSVLTGTLWDERSNRDTSAEATFFLQQSPPPRPAPDRLFGLESPMDTGYLPQPLSSARHFTSNGPPSRISADNDDVSRIIPAWEMASVTHSRNNSGESISWLNTKDDDSGASSCSSSVHSISSRSGVRRKHLHTGSGATEAEFDAALDAAVEAAYDDGYEPYDDDDPLSAPDHIQSSLRNVELAKERVREMEREEAIVAARRRDKEMRVRGELLPHVRKSFDFEYENSEAEEEERILEEMRKDYLLDDFDFGLQNKSALPRESDSSAYSNSTWNSSSFSSKRTTGGLSLTTVTEASESSRMSQVLGQGSQKPLPATALPPILDDVTPRTTQIEQSPPPPPPANVTSNQGVRDRRLSGQNPKQLKIETSISLPTNQGAPLTQQPNSQKDGLNTLPPYPKSAFAAGNKFPSLDAEYEDLQLPNSVPPSSTTGSGQLPALGSADTLTTISPATPQLGQVGSIDNNIAPGSPIGPLGRSHPSQLRKNKSSLSLKNRNLSVSSPDGSEGSVGTPLSSTFTVFPGRKQSSGNILQTPMLPTFSGSEALPTGGMHLFESDIHSPYSPGSPNPMAVNAPIPLEPCPDSYMLRPFWLMRCFYQTIAHPRGGYLSTKLFVPRDVWRVKGVKIKATEEKISNCDLLTAALLKLGAVDSNDADAMLEEMQSLENVLDQVQTNLMKKLGNEVGVQGVQTLFKEAYAVGSGVGSDTYPNPEPPKSAVSQSKNYLTSWRKLRSKNSAVGLASTVSVSKEVTKDSLTMSTLPMTSLPNIRFAKRDISHVEFSGPNATYMSALARLFDAAQVIDQIARQVEDPGLKHSSPTHVGLELSTRHAAEFFGFYICRFVLTDLTVMLDKFIKRGSEWVLV